MTHIALIWELGAGQGHLVPHRELLRELIARNHSVHVVSRDLLRAGRVFAGLPVRLWQAPLSGHSPEKIFQPTVTLSHVLHNVGFANGVDLCARIAAWRNLLGAIRPSLLIADYSPTALLAARGLDIRTITVGMGFCLPPRVQSLPAFVTLRQCATPEQLAVDEARLVSTINQSLAQYSAPTVSSLAEVFHSTNVQWLTTLPEVDHYPDRGAAEYWGLAPERRGTPGHWPAGERRRIFAYLKPFPHVESLLQLLNRLELPTVVACDGLSTGIREEHASRTLSFAPPNVDLWQMAQECYLAITNANHTTTTRFLLAGKPVLMIPLHLEQELVAHAVESHQLGVTVRLREPRDVFSQLAELLNKPAYHAAAATFATKYVGKFENRLEKMTSAIESLVGSR